MSISVRRIRADEWAEVRALRLRALQDPAAGIAFLDTFENASAQPDGFWQARTTGGAEDEDAAQFVAVSSEGEWIGSLTVLHAGSAARAALVVGVYVAPEGRGRGAIDALFDAAAAWSVATGSIRLRLEVHVENARARAAYERNGFVLTGELVESSAGTDQVMVRPIGASTPAG